MMNLSVPDDVSSICSAVRNYDPTVALNGKLNFKSMTLALQFTIVEHLGITLSAGQNSTMKT